MRFQTPSFVRRQGIVLSREQCPYDAALTFNAGVLREDDGYRMLFRNDYGFCRQDFVDFYNGVSDNTVPHTNIGTAFSRDGVHWSVEPDRVLSWDDGDIWRIYDPRLVKLEDGRGAMTFAVDSRCGTRCGTAVTGDFRDFEVVDITVPENRNVVLFPKRINGLWMRLERPFAVTEGCHSGIWISESPDLVHWGRPVLLLSVENVPFSSDKLGPAAPPVLTDAGWLVLFHAVEECEKPFAAWERAWKSRYCCGAMLLDSEEPRIVRHLAEVPLMVPETDYELDGFRGGVIFPGALIPESDGSVKIYYGAADTCECLATAPMSELIAFCRDGVKLPEKSFPGRIFSGPAAKKTQKSAVCGKNWTRNAICGA